MTERETVPAAYLERAARILGVPLSSECLPGVIADYENFMALFQTADGSMISKMPIPPQQRLC